MSNKELIANLRGENLDCDCAAYSRSECCCSTNWPESFCEEAADALELADKRIAEEREQHDIMMERGAEKLAEAERKLEIAMDALKVSASMPRSHEAHRRATQALAQIETDQ